MIDMYLGSHHIWVKVSGLGLDGSSLLRCIRAGSRDGSINLSPASYVGNLQ